MGGKADTKDMCYMITFIRHIGHKQVYRDKKNKWPTGMAEWRMNIIAKWSEVLFYGDMKFGNLGVRAGKHCR